VHTVRGEQAGQADQRAVVRPDGHERGRADADLEGPEVVQVVPVVRLERRDRVGEPDRREERPQTGQEERRRADDQRDPDQRTELHRHAEGTTNDDRT
jgi:hypothetical protein